MKIIDNRQPKLVKFSTIKPGDVFRIKGGSTIFLKINDCISDYPHRDLEDVDKRDMSIYAFVDENKNNALCLSDIAPSFLWFNGTEEVEPLNAELIIK